MGFKGLAPWCTHMIHVPTGRVPRIDSISVSDTVTIEVILT